MASRLYPDLSEPWSDLDDEELGEKEETSVSGHFYSGRDRETPSHEASTSHQVHPNSSVREHTDAVNLKDFQDYYLRHSSRRQDRYYRRNSEPLVNSASSSIVLGRKSANHVFLLLSRGRETISRGVEWFSRASLWKKALITGLLGLLCAMVFNTLRGTPSKDNYLQCPLPNDSDFPPCISEPELKLAKMTVHKMADILHNRAAQYICGAEGITSLTLSLGELKHLLLDVSPGTTRNVFHLILVNPHWNIRWMDQHMKEITDWTHYPHSDDIIASTSPSLSLKCRILLQLASMWSYIQWALIVFLCAALVYICVALYLRKRRREEAEVFALVGRIMDVMKYHYKKSCNKKDLLPYLAIIHIRDMLIPPSERKAKEQLWNKAIYWIASHESRVRVETRRIAGEDFEVWRWIQEDPPPTDVPVSKPPQSSGDRSHGNWHGSVFDHYPPEITTKVAPPTGTPSLCIRLKNMFEPIKRMPEGQSRELENAVLERCHSHGAVVHVWIDKKSPFGCVYLKMDSLNSAMGAYNALHGGWYKGKLVTAKYIPEDKYHKWFPRSMNTKTPLLPS